jgi:26S proteasome regulatory subunit N10
MAASTGGGGGGGEANPFAEFGGVNPDLDPELAMALRLSAEEARAHEESQSRVSGKIGSAIPL